MIVSIISVLVLLYYACIREWLLVLALACWQAVKLVDYFYPSTLPLWLPLSVAGVVLVMTLHQYLARGRRGAASVR
ncbi:hypothetical protein HUX88_10285 [Duganella sp. BJB1802]|uniref:hypothetical protein n=1 Tax=Duganella sp. BJB1802 TaxID=2744575 RepID=UPI001593731E|nr:hypothetical protein [Duganella sp. BJB1802]NVD70945.1 hypothetical protein [Duganella sp. BJB1802]